MDLVVIEERRRDLGQRTGKCVGKGKYCTRHHEGCTDIIVAKGCLVNSEWHDWYKENSANFGMPYSKAAVCEE